MTILIAMTDATPEQIKAEAARQYLELLQRTAPYIGQDCTLEIAYTVIDRNPEFIDAVKEQHWVRKFPENPLASESSDQVLAFAVTADEPSAVLPAIGTTDRAQQADACDSRLNDLNPEELKLLRAVSVEKAMRGKVIAALAKYDYNSSAFRTKMSTLKRAKCIKRTGQGYQRIVLFPDEQQSAD